MKDVQLGDIEVVCQCIPAYGRDIEKKEDTNCDNRNENT
jgi:hypothetical protein